MKSKLWLSYSWKDNTENDIDFIAAELGKRGIEVKLDRYVLSAGQRLWSQIEEQITDPNASDAWSVFMTQNSLTSEAILEEISYAVDRALNSRGTNFPVIGINPGDVDRASIPASLRTRLYVDLTDTDWLERVVASVEGRAPDISKPEVLPVFFREHELDGMKAIEARPRAGRWFPGFFALMESEVHHMDRFIQNPAGRANFDGSMFHGSFEYQDPEGTRWKGFTINHNITPINSIYIKLKGPITKLLVGSIDGDRLGVSYIYHPHN